MFSEADKVTNALFWVNSVYSRSAVILNATMRYQHNAEKQLEILLRNILLLHEFCMVVFAFSLNVRATTFPF